MIHVGIMATCLMEVNKSMLEVFRSTGFHVADYE